MSTNALSFEEVRKMRKGIKSYEVYNFPFMENIQIGLRVLSQNEILKAGNLGRQKANTILTAPTFQEVTEYSTRELLLMAVIIIPEQTTEEFQSFFKDAEDIGELSMDEIFMLLEHYNEVQEKYAPETKLEKKEDFDEMIEEVKKKSDRGMSLSTFTLRQLVHYLVADTKTLQSDNGTISTHSNNSKESTKQAIKKKVNLGIRMEGK